MTDDDFRQQIFNIIALRDLDRELVETEKLIEAVPRTLLKRTRRSKEAEQQLEHARDRLQGFKAHLKTLELELAQAEQAIDKANGNLLGARSNQEYTLLQEEIARRKGERGDIEDRILEQFEVIKQGEGMVTEAERELAEARAEFTEFEQRSEGQVSEHQTELEKLQARREQLRKGLSADVLTIYERVFKARGDAVAVLENNVCQGCFGNVTPNDVLRVRAAKALVLCPSCQRILFLPEILQAAR